MTTPNKTDILTAVTNFVNVKSRPCPISFLVETFGDDVYDVVDGLKESGALVGLRGRNGGLALPGSEIVVKRSEYAAKKAAKQSTVEAKAEAV